MEIKIVQPKETLSLDSDKIIHKINLLQSYKIDRSEIKKISILTNDKGPVLDDVALALFFDMLVLVLPSEHKSYSALYEKISKLFLIDYNEVNKAMSCADNAEFVLWSV